MAAIADTVYLNELNTAKFVSNLLVPPVAWRTLNSKRVYLWQSRVEIEGYSVTYFDRIAAFEVLYC